jgi:hypothetical protein
MDDALPIQLMTPHMSQNFFSVICASVAKISGVLATETQKHGKFMEKDLLSVACFLGALFDQDRLDGLKQD